MQRLILVLLVLSIERSTIAADAASTQQTIGDTTSNNAASDLYDEIFTRWEKSQNRIKSILVEYVESTTLLQDLDVLARHARMRRPGEKFITIVRSGNNFYYSYREEGKDIDDVIKELRQLYPKYAGMKRAELFDEVSHAELLRAYDAASVTEKVRKLIFDGNKLAEVPPNVLTEPGENGPVSKSALIYHTIPTGYTFFPTTYLHRIGWAPPDPGLSVKDQYYGHHSIPHMLSTRSVEIEDRGDGTIALLANGGKRQFILRPGIEAQVVSYLSLAENGHIASRTTCEDFVDIESGVKFPKTLRTTLFGRSSLGGGLAGLPLKESLIRVRRIEANRPEHEQYFHFTPEAGTYVLDTTLAHVAPDGSPAEPRAAPPGVVQGVSYRQPADVSKLDEVVEAARLIPDEVTVEKEWKYLPLLIGNALVLLAIFVVAFLCKRN